MTTIVEDVKLDFQDVLLMPKRSELSSRYEVDLKRTFNFKHSRRLDPFAGIPIIAANMDSVGTISMANVLYRHHVSVALHKFYPVEKLVEFFKTAQSVHTFYTTGITDDDFIKLATVHTQLIDAGNVYGLRYVCVDVANGYSRKLAHFVEKLRSAYPGMVIMAGNVVTPDMVYDLIERGADIVKVGIGSGSACTTRKITGVGYPQLSAILECADAAHGAGGLICGDGGITCPGDVAKALAAGADFVMVGGLFAGHDECEGELIYDESAYLRTSTKLVALLPDAKPTSVKFYGMSSDAAMKKHYGEKASYRASEGRVLEVPYRGSVEDTIEEMLGGIRSACTYVGAKRLKDLPKCATFIRVNRVLNESLSMYDTKK